MGKSEVEKNQLQTCTAGMFLAQCNESVHLEVDNWEFDSLKLSLPMYPLE